MQIALTEFLSQVRALASATDLPLPLHRYEELVTFDPYPEIPPALLHSGHLASYAIMTGMIDPFECEAVEKPATYLVPLEGPVRFLDADGNRQSFYLSKVPVEGESDVRGEFELMPNSLCYVTLRPTFRMPAYIAGRFNLLIRDVYRGLLVGTGPLVDPGFNGRLSIPLHNFTSNKYVFRAGEEFVYFEFTKLAWTKSETDSRRRPLWVGNAINDQPPFPGSKNKRRTIDDYLVQATGGQPAQNAIQNTVATLEKTAKNARLWSNTVTVGAVAGGLIFVLTALAVFVGALQLYLGSQQFTQSAQTDTAASLKEIRQEISKLQAELERIDQSRGAQKPAVNKPP